MKMVYLGINESKCKFYLPEDEKNIKRVLIICDAIKNKYTNDIIKSIINKNIDNTAVLCFDFFKTNKFNKIKESLDLYKSLNKLENIYLFLNENYKNVKIDILSFSFSAYITVLGVIKLNLKFESIFLVDPELDMSSAFKGKLLIEDLIDFRKIHVKNIKSVKIIREINDLYKEFKENIIYKEDIEKIDNIDIFESCNVDKIINYIIKSK